MSVRRVDNDCEDPPGSHLQLRQMLVEAVLLRLLNSRWEFGALFGRHDSSSPIADVGQFGKRRQLLAAWRTSTKRAGAPPARLGRKQRKCQRSAGGFDAGSRAFVHGPASSSALLFNGQSPPFSRALFARAESIRGAPGKPQASERKRGDLREIKFETRISPSVRSLDGVRNACESRR